MHGKIHTRTVSWDVGHGTSGRGLSWENACASPAPRKPVRSCARACFVLATADHHISPKVHLYLAGFGAPPFRRRGGCVERCAR
eukprot:3503084-Alexandrium_andersonii.AAC.1